ncbi:MAG: ergothioneine biosynthesis protein EgtB [Chloracidobacterium sp.]|nr:ergothioneine biosynthesis protein EgtB [Chloracidobacterium sp.]MCC6826051.1 ergothioneine biosynthesis protein EgtB [Acidobacteriota bacterium]MCO5333734.1 ergothioneine biosynthesis protein EgtB [Pyrinomonadaceae bacterium]
MQAVKKNEPGESLADLYSKVRGETERLCEPLEIEDYVPQPVVDVSPPRWNIAHTTWFFEEMILSKRKGYERFDPHFAFLFNSYYNTVGERTQRDRRGWLSRPTVKRVYEYRKYVDEKMLELLTSGEPLDAETEAIFVLGLNHEQQHQELFLTDLKYTFSVNPIFPVYCEGFAPEEAAMDADGGFVDIEEGLYEIGYAGDGFCFDNELARHKVWLDGCQIASSLVTNAEFIEFINDGGYRIHYLWHADGWDWVNRNNADSPLYWHKRDGGYMHYTLSGLRPLPLDAPVCHISFYEAAAFAEWKGERLPTEFEWEAANQKFRWGLRWEWTNSAYLPYPHFAKGTGAVGEYNGKFMIDQMVLRGASVATPKGHSRPTYRNFFQPRLRWQFTGIRLCRK